jgi:hypothetical protein
MPYIMNWNAGVQWEFASNLLLDLNYQGSAGVGLLNYWNVNQMRPDISSDPAELETIRRAPQDYRPYPHFGQIRLYSNFGHSSYHGGTVKLERRFSSGVSFTSFYTFSKAIDEDSDDSAATGVSYYNRALEKARSDYDVTHRWVSYWTWELPFGRGKRWLNSGGVLGHLIGNWQFNGINTIESGSPVRFTHNGNLPSGASVFIPTGSGGPVGVLRPHPASGKTYDDIKLDWDRKGPCRHQTACAEPWADINAFAIPGSFEPGTIGRNIIDGPGLIWQQVSLARVIPINERIKGTLRFDLNQPFKFPFFNSPGSTVDFRNPQNFGKITGTIGSFSGQGGRTYMHVIFKLQF